jgi:DNA-directed RNA polymerase specialized sigma24 family protein
MVGMERVEKRGARKLDREQVKELLELDSQGVTYKVLAEKYGVSVNTIGNTVRRELNKCKSL